MFKPVLPAGQNIISPTTSPFLSEIQEAQIHPVLCVQSDWRCFDRRLRGKHPDMGKICRRCQNTRQRGQRLVLHLNRNCTENVQMAKMFCGFPKLEFEEVTPPPQWHHQGAAVSSPPQPRPSPNADRVIKTTDFL